jgi:putative FMN-dependent luciferase-like monooxygenase
MAKAAPKYHPGARPHHNREKRVISTDPSTDKARAAVATNASAATPPTPTRLRLGFLTRLEVGADPADSYKFALEMFIAAEELGYDTGWIAQHHFLNGDGRLPSAFPFLAAAANATRRIGLGTGIVTLPLEDPVRVAEDAAFVDVISGGRLQLGLGPGGDPLTFAALSRDVNTRREDHARGIEIIRDALVGKPINGTMAVMYPTSPTLPERIWEATFSVDGGARIGKNGNGLLLARTAAMSRDPADVVQEPIGQAYLREIAALPVPVAPRLGLSRTVYAAADHKTALADMSGGVARWVKILESRGAFPPGLTMEEAFARTHIHYGHPEEVIESVQADRLFPMTTELICQVQPGAPTQAQILKNLETIAKHVAPALGWQPSRPAVAEGA